MVERWSIPEGPLAIDYQPRMLREIGVHARANPTCGVLFGSMSENLVSIEAWRPIDLPPTGQPPLGQLLSAAKADPALTAWNAVGWFVSHARSRVKPSASDVEAFNHWFPRDWPMLLVVEPLRDGSAMAAFFARGTDGVLQSESRRAPLRLEAEPGEYRPPPPPKALLPTPAAAVPRRGPWPPDRRQWIWAIPALLAFLVFAMLLYRPRANPAPSLAFQVADEGGELRMAWDKNSEPVQNAVGGLLEIHDGQAPVEFKLEREKLRRGTFSYARKSGDLELRLTVYRANNPPLQESARFVGPPPGRPPADDSAEVRRQRDSLQTEADRLREALRKETRRSQQLERAVRILENRLEVDRLRNK